MSELRRAAVLKVFTAEIEKFHIRCLDLPGAKVGGISVLHRFDSALKIDVHWHLLYADGVWTKSGENPPVFHVLGKLQPEDVPHVLASIAARTHKLLKHRGLLRDELDESNEAPTDEFAEKEPALAALLKSSLFDLALFGPKQKPERERGPRPAVVLASPAALLAIQLIAAIAGSEIAVKILAHLKLPITAEGFLPIRAAPWEDPSAGSGHASAGLTRRTMTDQKPI